MLAVLPGDDDAKVAAAALSRLVCGEDSGEGECQFCLRACSLHLFMAMTGSGSAVKYHACSIVATTWHFQSR